MDPRGPSRRVGLVGANYRTSGLAPPPSGTNHVSGTLSAGALTNGLSNGGTNASSSLGTASVVQTTSGGAGSASDGSSGEIRMRRWMAAGPASPLSSTNPTSITSSSSVGPAYHSTIGGGGGGGGGGSIVTPTWALDDDERQPFMAANHPASAAAGAGTRAGGPTSTNYSRIRGEDSGRMASTAGIRPGGGRLDDVELSSRRHGVDDLRDDGGSRATSSFFGAGNDVDESYDDEEGLEGIERPPVRSKPLKLRVTQAVKKSWRRARRLVFGIEPTLQPRSMTLSGWKSRPDSEFVPNLLRNQKYTVITFVPVVLYEQFRFFFNLYFLVVALTQFIPALKLGFLFTYIAPLVFVLAITMLKEAYDDFLRFRRDTEANSQRYDRVTEYGVETIKAGEIRVGDMMIVHTNQRVPADGVLLRTTERGGACFIRTDQLDGETDWKLRHAVQSCQQLSSDADLMHMDAKVYAEAPRKDIYEFVGTFQASGSDVEALGLENTMWANCVVASGSCVLLVIYTGKECRAAMNANQPRTKVGLLDMELNRLSKVLFLFMLALSLLLVSIKGFHGMWYIYLFRFILLFSSIIPISLRVNLDMGKTMYSMFIEKDKMMTGTVVRNSSIPEELGRISFLLSDKTGTLTSNDMVFKKLHLGSVCFSRETLMHVRRYLSDSYEYAPQGSLGFHSTSFLEGGHTSRVVREAILALALCHNVTPVVSADSGSKDYQASSPDEIALVKFAEQVGLSLTDRSLSTIVLQSPRGAFDEYEILQSFPFTSERKRAGIIVRNSATREITFYLKGADTIMQRILFHTQWLSEECDNLAREGLRTLVVAKRVMSEDEYSFWESKYREAKARIVDRNAAVDAAIQSLESDMTFVALTGVEDKLQQGVPESLEKLRNAGIRVWMLTGDKVDTAICVARASKLFSRNQRMRIIQGTRNINDIRAQLADVSALDDFCLVVDGTVLDVALRDCPGEFFSTASAASAVAVCRCSPTQKAQVVHLLKDHHPTKRVASVGDGGNDVAMITAADVGIGLVGKEGKQASLAADFSILQFSFITRLLLWHGRNSYKRSARLSQFVMHRGLIISVIQAVFSAVFYFAAIPIYTGWLMVGYATYYTMLPVFSIVMDTDVDDETALMYPELYRELQKGRSLSYKTFLIWVFKSIYQGATIMVLAFMFFENSLLRIVSITFTALILTELLMVIFEVNRITRWMCAAEVISFAIYILSILLLPTYFDSYFMFTFTFWWKVSVITSFSVLPVYIAKIVQRRLNPPAYTKLSSQ